MPAQGQTGQFPRPVLGRPPGQRRKPDNRTQMWLWLGGSGAALVVAVFVLTAFVVPGFLLGDDGHPRDSVEGEGAQGFAQHLANTLMSGDRRALTGLGCPGADPMVTEVVEDHDMIEKVTVGRATEKGDTATAKVTMTVLAETFTFTGGFRRDENGWCWQSLAVGTAG